MDTGTPVELLDIIWMQYDMFKFPIIFTWH